MIITTKILVFLEIFLFLIVFVAYICGDDSYYAGSGGNCRESERMALLQLKAELIDDFGRLSSWESITNCCEWNGVVCDNRTDHVVALDLHGHMHVIEHGRFYQYSIFDRPLYPAAPLRGKISPSLLQLPHLQYLDLSLNDFNETTIPSFIGSFTKLHHLNLSYSHFGGHIPHHIGNLSVLRLLDLSFNVYLTDTNLDWLAGCPSLQYLNLSWANLETSSTWLQVIHKLTALKELHLSGCNLPTLAPISVPSHNSSNSLLVLDLSFNYFTYSTAVFHSFLNISSSFTYIDFSGNYFPNGRIPHDFGNLISLSHLDLSFASLESRIPDALANLTNLSYLDLSQNELQGEFPQPPQNTSSLTYLDLSWNRLNGQLPRILTRLHDSTRIKYLSLSDNLLSGSFPNMSRFTLLEGLYLGNNGLSGALLEGILRQLPNLEYLDLSRNKFVGRLPNFSSCQPLRVLALFDNAFNGSLSESIQHLSKIEYLDVGYNQLEGVFNLSILPHLRVLGLSFNLNITLTTTPSWIHPLQFQELALADCKLGPYFPAWLQNQNQLEYLDISNSGIFDTIPAWSAAAAPLTGKISPSLLQLSHLQYLDLSLNAFNGRLPNLSSCQSLRVLDLFDNAFNGSLSESIEHLSKIESLRVGSNHFDGVFNLSNHPHLRELDLSFNLNITLTTTPSWIHWGHLSPHGFKIKTN